MFATRCVHFVILVVAPISASPSVWLRGEVALPAGKTAPASGMRVELQANVADYEFQCKHCFDTSVTIKAGEALAPFAVEIKNTDQQFYRLRFFHESAGYARSGYWSQNGALSFGAANASARIDISRGDVSGIRLVLLADASVKSRTEEIADSKKYALTVAKRVMKPHYTDFEKALVAHDYLVNNFRYFDDTKARGTNLKSYQDVYTDYFQFASGLAICGSYSSAFELLMQSAGVTIATVKTIEQGAHAWNQVSIGGSLFHLDTTSNDRADGFQYGVFMLTDAQAEVFEAPYPHSPNPDAEPFEYNEEMYVHRAELQSTAYARIFGNIRLGAPAPASGLWVSATGYAVNGMRDSVRIFIPANKSHAFLAMRFPRAKNTVLSLRREDNGAELFAVGKTAMMPQKTLAARFDLSREDLTGLEWNLSTGNFPPIALPAANFQLKNLASGKLLTDKGGRTGFSEKASDQNTVWVLEKAEGDFYRIRNAASGCYLHIEGQKGFIQCEANAGAGWWSAQWKISGLGEAGVFIENRWALNDEKKIPATLSGNNSGAEGLQQHAWQILPQ